MAPPTKTIRNSSIGHGNDGPCSLPDQLSSCLSINYLPDSILRFIGEYLRKSSRAIMASALSRSACFESDTLDFSDTGRDLAPKLTDSDISNILVSIDAVNALKVLKLIGCENITGVGLEPIRGSTVLRHIDLRISSEHMLLEEAVTPILDSIICREGRALRLIELPDTWRTEKSQMLCEFLERFNNAQNRRTCVCTSCSEGFQGSPWVKHDEAAGGLVWGLQNYTCYDCLKYFCDDCEPPLCQECEKKICEGCCPTHSCGYCDKIACSECDEFDKCDECGSRYCPTCMPVIFCDCCERSRCMECVPYHTCSGCRNVSNCAECAHENNVQWCEVCQDEHCNDCRHKAYKEGELPCTGCRGLLLPRITRENEADTRKKQSLRERLDEIESGLTVNLSEADIEFVMNRADCSRKDAIWAVKNFYCPYRHLSNAINLLNLQTLEHGVESFGRRRNRTCTSSIVDGDTSNG
mmetsp:Transcript_29525/g.44648  ORF Transcript_29525/g.44648 Transcript_29525/m.44648 type:complete len:467 (-) Transcript_29525:83-1483(-)